MHHQAIKRAESTAWPQRRGINTAVTKGIGHSTAGRAQGWHICHILVHLKKINTHTHTHTHTQKEKSLGFVYERTVRQSARAGGGASPGRVPGWMTDRSLCNWRAWSLDTHRRSIEGGGASPCWANPLLWSPWASNRLYLQRFAVAMSTVRPAPEKSGDSEDGKSSSSHTLSHTHSHTHTHTHTHSLTQTHTQTHRHTRLPFSGKVIFSSVIWGGQINMALERHTLITTHTHTHTHTVYWTVKVMLTWTQTYTQFPGPFKVRHSVTYTYAQTYANTITLLDCKILYIYI